MEMIDSAGPNEHVHSLVQADGLRGRAGVGRSPWVDMWVRRCGTLMVAGVAAYSSYEHQWHFAAAGGADPAGAKLWPLSVDGLLLLASIGLLRTGPHDSRRTRTVLRAAFGLGIAVSLVANIAAAPVLGWQPVLVAGWPPVALLLAVELLADHPTPAPSSPAPPTNPAPRDRTLAAAPTSHQAGGAAVETAEQWMWAHYQHERAAGRTPTGADLDRIAGTNNYGRAVLTRADDVQRGPSKGSSSRWSRSKCSKTSTCCRSCVAVQSARLLSTRTGIWNSPDQWEWRTWPGVFSPRSTMSARSDRASTGMRESPSAKPLISCPDTLRVRSDRALDRPGLPGRSPLVCK
jgi:hypothetical protein